MQSSAFWIISSYLSHTRRQNCTNTRDEPLHYASRHALACIMNMHDIMNMLTTLLTYWGTPGAHYLWDVLAKGGETCPSANYVYLT